MGKLSMELAPPQRPASHRTERLPNSAFTAPLPPRIETNQKPCDNISNLCEGVAIMAARGNGKDRHRRRGREAGRHARKESGIFRASKALLLACLKRFRASKELLRAARSVFVLQKGFCGLLGVFSAFKSTFAGCPERFWASKVLSRFAQSVFGFQKNFCGSLGTFSAFKRTFAARLAHFCASKVLLLVRAARFQASKGLLRSAIEE